MITSTANEKVKKLLLLQKKKKARDEEGVFLAEGLRMFFEAPAERIRKVYFSETLYNKKKQDLKTGAFPVEILSDNVFCHVSDTKTPQGVLCVVERKAYRVDDLLRIRDPHFVVLDHLQDPGNLGTIVRTAEGAGVDAVFLSAGSADIYQPKAIRSTMGSIYRMPVVYVDSLSDLLERFRERGIRSYAAYPDGRNPYDREDYRGGTAILVGNEGNGLSQEAAGRADVRIQIPMRGQVESLNAAVAASILMFEVYRQRR